jgi:hypothetical protein
MASLGSLRLDNTESGIAQRLVKPPQARHEFNYRGATFRAAPDTGFIVCCFSGARSHTQAISMGSELLQDGLDMWSIFGRADLATRDAPDEYFAWWRDGGKSVIAVVDTGTFSFHVPPISIEVRDVGGQIVPPKRVTPQHHLGFRFYRLSQVSDDLFDAFRNMYLAFELLLSAKYPKGAEREIDWLRASLVASTADLNLVSLAPAGVDPVTHIIDKVYLNARLPLFHAKDGKTYFAPVTSNRHRREVQHALQLLTLVVIRMAEAWYQARRLSGGVNLQLISEADKRIFDKVSFVASSSSDFNLEGDLSQAAIERGIRFEGKFTDQFDNELRPHVCGQVDLRAEHRVGVLNLLAVVDHQKPLLVSRLEAHLDLSEFDVLEGVCFLRSINATEPRTLFPR